MHISFTHPPRPPNSPSQRGEVKDNANQKKQNKIDGNESHQVLAAEDIIAIIQQRPALLDTGGVDSYQMTNSGKQQRCFFFLSANGNKKTKKKAQSNTTKETGTSQQTRAARSTGSSDDSSACLLNIGREACGVAGPFQRGCEQGHG